MVVASNIDWARLADAVAADDIDAALAIGLLDWDGSPAEPLAAGIDTADVASMIAAHGSRTKALAARERHRLRNARLERLQAERRERQARTLSTDGNVGKPALTGAAAAALARALVKAGR